MLAVAVVVQKVLVQLKVLVDLAAALMVSMGVGLQVMPLQILVVEAVDLQTMELVEMVAQES